MNYNLLYLGLDHGKVKLSDEQPKKLLEKLQKEEIKS